METLALICLLAATIASGLLAGVFWLYSHTVMPALRRLGDREFVDAFAAMDRAIINPWFMLGGFLGAPLLTAAAVALTAGEEELPWTAAALACHAGMAAITIGVNVPRNNALKAAVPGVDPASVRAAFDEARWLRWNHARVVLSIAAAGLLAWALTVATP